MKHAQIILSLVGLVGTAREVMSETVQSRLHEMGFESLGHDPKRINCKFDDIIVVGFDKSSKWNSIVTLANVNDAISIGQISSKDKVFTVQTQLDQFLFAAKQLVEQNNPKIVDFKGVKLTIRKEGVLVDSTDLLNEVYAEAQRLWEERFPKPSV